MSNEALTNGVIRKTNSKSKFRTVGDDGAHYIFNEEKPRLTENGEEIVLLQVMPLPLRRYLIEFVYKKDWDGNL